MTGVAIERGGGRPKLYKTDAGRRVPSVTTILSRWKESGGLVQWAYQQGIEGVELYAKRDQACDIGSAVHNAVEDHVHGLDGWATLNKAGLDQPSIEAAIHSYKAYLAWEGSARVKYLATEVPLISNTHRFGGTIDCVASIGDDEVVILDWKSAKALYQDNLLQVAAYALMWEECRKQPVSVAHICRFSKTGGAFEHRRWPNLDLAKEQFLRLRTAYEVDQKLNDLI